MNATPGPWTAQPDDFGSSYGHGYVTVDSPDGIVAHIQCSALAPVTGTRRDLPFADNARLISAAPALLAALQRLVGEAERCGIGELADNIDPNAYVAALAAIAAAEGTGK